MTGPTPERVADTAQTSTAFIGAYVPPPHVRETIQDCVRAAMQKVGETWNDVIAVACPVDVEAGHMTEDPNPHGTLEHGFFSSETPFTIWTRKRVYFPCHYDGGDWVHSVPRDPCGEFSPSQGGG